MAYVSPELRRTLEPVVDRVIDALRELELDFPESSTEGNLNYIFSRVLADVYHGGGYKGINDAIGVLECAKLEFYRRVGADVNTVDRQINGDVY